MKPIMLACAIVLAFAVSLPSAVWAQDEGEAAEAQDEWPWQEAAREAEAAAREAEAAAERAIALAREGNITASHAAVDEAEAAVEIAMRWHHRAFSIVGMASNLGFEAEALALAEEAKASLIRAREAEQRASDIMNDASNKARRVRQAEAARKAESEAAEAPEIAREAAERAIADYRVIEREAVLAERAARAAQRALTEAEGEDDDDYMEAWEHAQYASGRAQAITEILRQAERLAVSAKEHEEAIGRLFAEARGSSHSRSIEKSYNAALRRANNAVKDANKVANLRAQLKE